MSISSLDIIISSSSLESFSTATIFHSYLIVAAVFYFKAIRIITIDDCLFLVVYWLEGYHFYFSYFIPNFYFTMCIFLTYILSKFYTCLLKYWWLKNSNFVGQVSRSIGAVYLKKPAFSDDPLYKQSVPHVELIRSVLTAEPSIGMRKLKPHDRFLIFASDGLWEQLSDEAAVEMVFENPRAVSSFPNYLSRKKTLASIL